MFVICPDFNAVPFDKEQHTRYANSAKDADKIAAEMTLHFPDSEIYIFRAIKKVRLTGKPQVATYTITDKGEVLPA